MVVINPEYVIELSLFEKDTVAHESTLVGLVNISLIRHRALLSPQGEVICRFSKKKNLMTSPLDLPIPRKALQSLRYDINNSSLLFVTLSRQYYI